MKFDEALLAPLSIGDDRTRTPQDVPWIGTNAASAIDPVVDDADAVYRMAYRDAERPPVKPARI